MLICTKVVDTVVTLPTFRIATNVRLWHSWIVTSSAQATLPVLFSSRSFEDQEVEGFEKTLSILSLPEQTKQRNKARMFFQEALSSIKIHFRRWANELLPLALGGEQRTAQLVANKILRLKKTPNVGAIEVDDTFYSPVHDRQLPLKKFRIFIEEQCTLPPEYEVDCFPTEINNGLDLWSEDQSEFRQRFCINYMPLFSNSQPAESAVKEAKIVSTTGSHEQTRSVRAIGRAGILPSCKEAKNGKQKAGMIIDCVLKQHSQLSDLREKGTDAFTERRVELINLLGTGHFQNLRLEKSKRKMVEKGHKNKVRNTRQKTRGIVETGAVSGKYQIGLLYKNDNLDQMKQELTFRGLSFVDGQGKEFNYPAMKAILKEHEKTGNYEGYDEKWIRSLSGARFVERIRNN